MLEARQELIIDSQDETVLSPNQYNEFKEHFPFIGANTDRIISSLNSIFPNQDVKVSTERSFDELIQEPCTFEVITITVPEGINGKPLKVDVFLTRSYAADTQMMEAFSSVAPVVDRFKRGDRTMNVPGDAKLGPDSRLVIVLPERPFSTTQDVPVILAKLPSMVMAQIGEKAGKVQRAFYNLVHKVKKLPLRVSGGDLVKSFFNENFLAFQEGLAETLNSNRNFLTNLLGLDVDHISDNKFVTDEEGYIQTERMEEIIGKFIQHKMRLPK